MVGERVAASEEEMGLRYRRAPAVERKWFEIVWADDGLTGESTGGPVCGDPEPFRWSRWARALA